MNEINFLRDSRGGLSSLSRAKKILLFDFVLLKY